MRDDDVRHETATPVWRVTSASCKGSAHGAAAPNQDAVQVAAVTDDAGRDVWVAAVSDGHGGKRYVRSDVGSALAVDVCVTHLAGLVRHRDESPAYDHLLRAAMPAVVAQWRSGVLDHVREHPFTAAEETVAGEPLETEPLVSYGATLLAVIVGDEGIGLAQIGDGDALIRTHGFATRPVPTDPRLVGGETTSLCLDSAVDDFRYAGLPSTADPDLVLLASDGYGNSFADKDWWRAVVGDLAWFLSDHDFDEFASQFPGWLGESALVGGDDVSAVVITRSPLVVAPAEVMGAVVAPPRRSRPDPDAAAATAAGQEVPTLVGRGAVPPTPSMPSMPRTLPDPAEHHVAALPGPGSASAPSPPEVRGSRPRRPRRRVALGLAGVLLAIVAGGAAWLLTGGSHEPEAPPVTPSPSQSTTPQDPGGGGGGNANQPQGGNGDEPQKPRKHGPGAGQAGDG